MIDPRAIVDPGAKIGANVEIGPWSIVGPDVEIGDDCWIASHVVIRGPTRIGANNRIYQFSSVGEDTPALAYHGERTWLYVGDHNVIREGVTIHRGMVQDKGETRIGHHNLLMAYVHVGHDCVVGDHVIMANNAAISGHCYVGDHANIGGYVGVPQYRSIGAYTHIAALSLVLKDIPDYVTAGGHPAVAVGMNVEGMRRRGYDDELIAVLRSAYKTVYRQGLTVAEAALALAENADKYPEVKRFLDSIRGSKHGIVRESRA